MKIKVEFESLDEFKEYMGIASPSLVAVPAQAEPEITPEPAPAEAVQEAPQEAQEAPEAPKPKNNTKKTQKAVQAETEAAPEPDPEPAKVTEDFRIAVRKQLAALNKKRGYNRAAELISEQTGKSKLTEVDLADLPKLMKIAEEETNAD
ncbi:hypothetical protein [Neglectibacter timonensis]|uniref:hypothetical protein n=1 Tax=Neglectibacter timonensis TaxID=1776382 RepID=UPI0039931C5F